MKNESAIVTFVTIHKGKSPFSQHKGMAWEIFFNKSPDIYDILLKTGWIHREEECR